MVSKPVTVTPAIYFYIIPVACRLILRPGQLPVAPSPSQNVSPSIISYY